MRCPICGEAAAIETSFPNGDACCPACGQLLWWFRDRLPGVNFDRAMAEADLDSLDLVELIMELEEEFDFSISKEDAEKIVSVEDAIRYIRRRRPDVA